MRPDYHGGPPRFSAGWWYAGRSHSRPHSWGRCFRRGEGLIKEFGFDPDVHHAYVEKIFARYQNPYLEDEVLGLGQMRSTAQSAKPMLASRKAVS